MMSDASDCQKDSSDASRSSSEEQQSKHAEANLDVKNDLESPDTDQALRNVSQERESHVYTATSIILPSRQKTTRNHPLTLDWAFGINSTLPVFCLQDGEGLVILYVCAHVAVMFDHTTNTQHLLQGHCSPISCVCVSEDRRWLVTADKGQDSLVIVWDTYTGIPVRTLFDCHPEGGTVALALSHDSKHLVSVGATDVQRVCIWDWTSESESPLCVTELPEEFGPQKHILFNPSDNTQLLSTSESRVLFYTMEGTTVQYSAPEISDKTFKKVVGAFTRSVLSSEGDQAFSATSLGNLLIWAQKTDGTGTRSSYTALKLVPLQEDAITALTQIDSYIVTGDSRGHVKFYDRMLKLISHFSDFNLDSISSLSFATKLPSAPKCPPDDCTLTARPFIIRNLVISTATAIVVHVTSQGGVVQTLLKEHADSLQAVACHPRQPVVAMGSNSGILKLWNYEKKGLVCSRLFQKNPRIQCLAYDPYGVYLAAGFTSGMVCVLDGCSLLSEDPDSFTFSSDSITHIAFSHDSLYMATADEGKAVTLFHLCSEEGGAQCWRYQGRHHSHYRPIQELLFGEQLDTGRPRLLSLGEDRRLVEYDLKASGDDRLVVLSAERIEQSGVPTCMIWYPPLTTEHFLLTASHLYKMKLYNSTTKMCRKTLLGPCFGSPVRKMMLLPQNNDGDSKARYMAYITTDKVGVQILPLDGNPYHHSAQLCHPMGASSMAVSHEGRYVFTAGGADRTAFCWEISLSALEAAAALGGKDLTPFYSLLEGGRDGELFREMEDYFYYSQLRSQGLDSMATRQVSTHIPLAEVPFVMRALGFYPTEQELEDMQNEVKFSRYAETGQYVTHVDLPEFIRLFVNHRPVLGLRLPELQWALAVLGESAADDAGQAQIPRDRLMELLQARGEHMTEEELADCFSTLLGVNPEGGRCQSGAMKWQDTEKLLETEIPAEITLETFVKGILGLPLSNQEAAGSSSSSDTSALLPPKDTDEILS